MPILPANLPTVSPTFQPGKRQQIFILALIVLFTIISLFLYGRVKREKPAGVAAQVGSEEITKATVNQFASDCNVSQKEAVFYLVDEKVLSLWTLDEKIVISPQDQETEEKRRAGLNPPNPACVSLQARVNLLRQKLFQDLTKFKEGKFIVVNFDRYIPNPFARTSMPKAELEKLVQEERAYADKLVQSIYADLKTNKLTFDQAMLKVQNDPIVGLKSWYQTSPQSGPFSAQDYIEKKGLLSSEEVRNKVDTLSAGQISAPFIQKVDQNPGDGEPNLVEVRWIIAQVGRVGKGFSGTESELLAKVRSKYQAEIYLE